MRKREVKKERNEENRVEEVVSGANNSGGEQWW